MQKDFNDLVTAVEQIGRGVELLAEMLPIGTILPSVYPLEKFQETFGNGWILADGQGINPDSKFYKQTGRNVVPNMVGHVASVNFFIRIY